MLRASWLGRVPYRPTYELQRDLLERRKSGAIDNTLLLLEHDPVFTLGRRADESHVLSDDCAITSGSVEIVETDRGGEATFHGPGQLVAYPIISIRELKLGPVAYVRILEEIIIQVLREHGISGHRVVGRTGVWIGGEPGSKPVDGANPAGRKIAAIGVRISGGVAMHGMALNVDTDLGYFAQIVPCGMPGLDMTSMSRELGSTLQTEMIARAWAEAFADVLYLEIDWRPASFLTNIQSAQVSVSV